MVIVLALMTYCQNRDLLSILDFEQHHVASDPERNYQFPQKRIIGVCLATGERETAQQFGALPNRHQRPLGRSRILIKQKPIEAQSIFASLARVANPVIQRDWAVDIEAFSMRSSSA